MQPETPKTFGEMLIAAAEEMVAVHRGEKLPARVTHVISVEPTDTGETLAEQIQEVMQGVATTLWSETQPVRVQYHVIKTREGRVIPPPQFSPDKIRRSRNQLGLSVDLFAQVLNCSVSTVWAWEDGLREPNGTSRRLLEIAERHPDTLLGGVLEPENAGAPVETPKLRRAG